MENNGSPQLTFFILFAIIALILGGVFGVGRDNSSEAKWCHENWRLLKEYSEKYEIRHGWGSMPSTKACPIVYKENH